MNGCCCAISNQAVYTNCGNSCYSPKVAEILRRPTPAFCYKTMRCLLDDIGLGVLSPGGCCDGNYQLPWLAYWTGPSRRHHFDSECVLRPVNRYGCITANSLTNNIINNYYGKIQADGRKFLDRFKSYFRSQNIKSSQSLNEVHICRLQPKSATKGDFFFFK